MQPERPTSVAAIQAIIAIVRGCNARYNATPQEHHRQRCEHRDAGPDMDYASGAGGPTRQMARDTISRSNRISPNRPSDETCDNNNARVAAGEQIQATGATRYSAPAIAGKDCSPADRTFTALLVRNLSGIASAAVSTVARNWMPDHQSHHQSC